MSARSIHRLLLIATLSVSGGCGEECATLPATIDGPYPPLSGCVLVDRTEVVNGATLTVEPGTLVKFLRDGYLAVNRDRSGARIIAEAGDGEEAVVFTSGDSAPEPGSWQCLWVGGEQSESSFVGAEFEFGGAPCEVNGRLPEGMLVLDAEIARVHDGRFILSSTQGLFLEQDGRVRDRVERTEFGTNLVAPVRLPFSAVLSMGPGNTYDDGDFIAVDTISRLTESGDWMAQGAPYRLLRDSREGSDGTLHAVITTPHPGRPPNIVVRVTPGTEIQLDNGTLETRSAALVVEGTAAEPVVFTSAEEDRAPGDWGCLLFSGELADQPSSFDHAIVEWGGSGVKCTGAEYRGGIVFGTGDTSVRNTTFRHLAGQASIISGLRCAPEPGSEPWCRVGNDFDDDLPYEAMCQWTTGLYCLLDE